MILLKIAITVLAVTSLTIIAERVSPRAAGILSGYPLGSAISLFFIGLEQGAEFAGSSAPYTVAGLAATLSFLFVYYHISKRIRPLALSMAAASLSALAAFLLVSLGLHQIPLPTWGALLVAAAGIFGYGLLFRRIPNTGIARRVRLDPRVVLVRATLATLSILAITGAAYLVPPSWAGLFSAFPVTIFPLVLILHGTYGPEQAHTVIKNIPTGLWSLVLYALTISVTYPRMGIYWGTLVGFGMATLYLLGFSIVQSRRTRARRDRQVE